MAEESRPGLVTRTAPKLGNTSAIILPNLAAKWRRRRDDAAVGGKLCDTGLPRELSEHETRRLCNQLAADGFDLGYLETRFGITARRSA